MLVLAVLSNSPYPGLPNLEKPNNHVILLNQKHVSTLQSYGAIINGIFPKLNLKKETINPNEMKIKDELVLQGMNPAKADKIEYNTMGAFQTSNCNTHGYYIQSCLLLPESHLARQAHL